MIDKLYYTRHGQTDWNKRRRIMGRFDVPLNDEGRRQAEETAEQLKDTHFSVILVSPLGRAVETAKIIARHHVGTPLLKADGLIERDFGDYEGKVNDGNYFGTWDYYNDPMTKGERLEELYARTAGFLNEVQEKYGGNVLLVAHGGIGLMVEAYYRGIPDDGQLLRYAMENGELRAYGMKDILNHE